MRGWCYTTYILFLLDSSWVYFVKWSFCTLQQTLHALLQNKLTLLSLYTLTHQIIAIHTSIFLYFDKPNKYASILHLYILWRFQFTGTAVHLLYGRLAGWTAYMIMMIVSKMMLVMIIIVLKMMMLVMIKGVGECRLVAKSKHRPPRFDNFDKPDYPLFVHNVDPRLYQFELLEFYLRLSGHLAYLRKDERAVWSVWGHIFIFQLPELPHE